MNNNKKRSNSSSKSKNNTNKKKTTTVKTTNNKEVKKVKEEVKVENKTENNLDYKSFIIIILALLIGIIGIAKISGLFKNKDFSQSYLLKNKIVTNKEIVEDNMNSILLNKDVFVLVTSLNNEDEYNLEKDLKKVINQNNLKDNFYVYIYNNNKTNLNNIFKVSGEIKVPTILYYKNGNFVDMVKRDDQNMIEAADFAKLLDIYELSKEE